MKDDHHDGDSGEFVCGVKDYFSWQGEQEERKYSNDQKGLVKYQIWYLHPRHDQDVVHDKNVGDKKDGDKKDGDKNVGDSVYVMMMMID